MAIPDDLKIFSWIYEYRGFVLLPLLIGWGIVLWRLLIRCKRGWFFLWLLVLPVVIQGLNVAAVYSGWHYRMELRDRFARITGDRSGATNINLMPPEIHAEYAKHNFRPRFRDVKAGIVGIVFVTVLLYPLGAIAYGLVGRAQRKKRSAHDDPPLVGAVK